MSPQDRNRFLQDFYTNPLRPKLVEYLEHLLADTRDEHENAPVGNEVVRGKIVLLKELISTFNKE